MSNQAALLSSSPRASQLSPCERVIVALDFPSAAHSLSFLDDLRQRCIQPPVWVKVGLELFLAEGPGLVFTLRTQGYRIFLDLKLHDIPNTVAGAVRSLASLDVDLLTVHASGGSAMMRAAAEAAAVSPKQPRLLAVTVLTSMDAGRLEEVGVNAAPSEQVLRLARTARASGIHGLVASPLEADALRQSLGPALHLVTPGIRLAGAAGTDDQQRVATPAAALQAGADQLVIGRPITQAADPAAVFDAVLAEIERSV